MTSLVEASRLSPFAVFRRRNFTLMWFADFISTSGSALTYLAASILVYQITGSALSVGIMLIATALPSLLVGLIAGVFVDRYDRRRIMYVSDFLRGLLVLAIPFLATNNIIWLYILVFLVSTVDKFFTPAHESTLPELAPDEELAAANSFLAISSFGSTAIGFAASGLIAAAVDVKWAFYLDTLTFFTSATLIFLMKLPKFEVNQDTNVSNVIDNLKDGGRYLWDSPILRSSLLVGFAVFISFGFWNVLLLPFAFDALGAGEFVYGVQEALTSVGFVIGSFLMASYADRLREGQWFSLGILGMGIVGAIYSQATSIPFAILMVMISGYFNALMFIGRRLIFQRNTTREVRGRVSSAYVVVGDMLIVVGMGLAGLADVIDVRIMLLIASLVLVAAGGISLFLPGLGRPAEEWKRAISLLRGAELAPGLSAGRPASLADLDVLIRRLPPFGSLSEQERQALVAEVRVTEATSGTAVIKRGDKSNEAYIMLEGKAIAGRTEGEDYRVLERLQAGDFFGEIAAITHVPRTANVVVEEDAALLGLRADTLQKLMENQDLNRLFLSKMTERMARMGMIDLPQFTGVDETTLRELRTTPVATGE
jgi:MFS family permease